MKKWSVLFIKDEASQLIPKKELCDSLFDNFDITSQDEALDYLENENYDMIVSDLTIDASKIGFLKKIKDKKLSSALFAMVSPKDSNKLYSIADLGINAFELTPDQLDQALEALSNFDPYEKK